MDKHFNLIYVVFNTFFNLQTQEEQVQCFRCVSQHLAPGGVFLMEVFVPDLCRFTGHQTVRATTLTEHLVNLEVSQVDPVTQRVTAQHVLLSHEGTRLFPVRLRYAWPSELDLIARLAGLRLRNRWGGWCREPFTASSGLHVSVYAR
jgi:hypothetical protein